ncbi:MAG: hypothetical protein HKN49_07405 [Gammaproteobacteria bacterium]|nr:hypothetical protein [Gammaproteobacteria bacterium]
MNKLSIILLALAATGCASSPCDKVRPYQQVRPQDPLVVPDGLSEPELRSRAPEVDGQPELRRADGRCIEQPPAFDPAEVEAG